MRCKIIALSLLSTLLAGCHNSDPSAGAYNRPNPICGEIKQRLAGSATENIPSYRTVTPTERNELLQQYQDLGCTDGFDSSADESD